MRRLARLSDERKPRATMYLCHHWPGSLKKKIGR